VNITAGRRPQSQGPAAGDIRVIRVGIHGQNAPRGRVGFPSAQPCVGFGDHRFKAKEVLEQSEKETATARSSGSRKTYQAVQVTRS
jgi:hypothetical protein